mgnify:FL=1
MSAWIVSQNHIRLLVEALYKYEVIDDISHHMYTPDALGQMLWRENHKSVNYCHNRRSRTPHYAHDSAAVATWEYPCPGRGVIRNLTRKPTLVYRQARCYHYQSSEHAGWEKSQAYSLIARLLEVIEKTTGTDEMDGKEPWGIE